MRVWTASGIVGGLSMLAATLLSLPAHAEEPFFTLVPRSELDGDVQYGFLARKMSLAERVVLWLRWPREASSSRAPISVGGSAWEHRLAIELPDVLRPWQLETYFGQSSVLAASCRLDDTCPAYDAHGGVRLFLSDRLFLGWDHQHETGTNPSIDWFLVGFRW